MKRSEARTRHWAWSVFLDSTTIRAHRKTAGTTKNGDIVNAAEIARCLAAHMEALAPGSA
ncbi:hypothetical protein CDI09_14970 [Komagataeibacter nataicola]|uniref:Transposase n=1 Tax=Komagataeibacter nataicola TaxID=265960 RepID=A0ABX5PAG0_9PROT|nr:hypothetical protein CDI09_14970 [Komagataeibacter nataicola]